MCMTSKGSFGCFSVSALEIVLAVKPDFLFILKGFFYAFIMQGNFKLLPGQDTGALTAYKSTACDFFFFFG